MTNECIGRYWRFWNQNSCLFKWRHRTVETAEELDAIISLCEVCRQNSKRIVSDIEDSSEIRSVREESFLEEEAYIDLISLLNRLFEQREQYRLIIYTAVMPHTTNR